MTIGIACRHFLLACPIIVTPRFTAPARLLALACLLALGLLASPAPARDVEDLYASRVAVADRSPDERARGARAALAEVLVKLTGDRGVRRREGIDGVLGQASRLLFKYAYERAGDGSGLLLAAEFDEPALVDELTAAGIPLWGRQRPDTVAFVVIDEAGSRHILGSDEPGQRAAALLGRAARRGVPLLLPLVDIEETRHLATAPDWTAITTTALALAHRYGTTGVLVGHLRESVPGLWESRWQVQVGTEAFSWREEGDLAALLLEDAADRLADALARRFADPAVLASATTFTIGIEGIASAADYARVTTYLAALDAVSGLFVRSAAPARLEVELSVRGGRDGLAQTVAFGNVLTALPLPDSYRLLPAAP
ncbi:MAG: DUF2066 domain-containing protein [Gammaproteobacteria bacterium]